MKKQQFFCSRMMLGVYFGYLMLSSLPLADAENGETGGSLPPGFKEDGVMRPLDEFSDMAAYPRGKKVFRFYSQPRAIEKIADGSVKLRPDDWSYFQDNESLRFSATSSGNYEFSRTDGGGIFRVKSGDLEYLKSGQRIGAASTKTEISKPDRSTITKFKGIYPAMDVQFRDFDYQREKSIIINSAPQINADETLIFWEELEIPANSRVLLADDSELPADGRIKGQFIKIVSPNGESLIIDSPIIFDSKKGSDWEFDAQDLTYRVQKSGGMVRIGIEVQASHLLAKERVYPVLIDPTYTFCDTSGASGIPMSCSLTNFYLRQVYNGTEPNQPETSKLFIGRYKSGPAHFMREAVLRFSSNFDTLKSYGTITAAKLWMTYQGNGHPLANKPNVNVAARRITKNWSGAPAYSFFKTALGSYTTTTVNSGAAAGTKFSWDTTDTVKYWADNNGASYGLLLEPNPTWSSGNYPNSWPDKILVFRSKSYNSSSSPYIEVHVQGKADLTFDNTSISISPAKSSYLPGETVTLNFKAKNVGTASAGSSTTNFFFNTGDASYSDSKKIAGKSLNSLPANATAPVSYSYKIPANAAPGYHYFSFELDGEKNISEIDENNNKTYGIVKVAEPPKPNLYPYGYGINKTTFAPGESMDVYSKIQNGGSGSAGSSRLGLYFSKNTTLEDADNYKKNIYYGSISGDSTSGALSTSITIPDNFPEGTYYLLYKADYENYVTESNESDNVAYKQFTVKKQEKVDIFATNFSLTSTAKRYTGDTISVSGTAGNQGGLSTSGVDYIMLLKNTSTGATYSLTNLSTSTFSFTGNSSGSGFLSGKIPQTCSIPNSGTYKVEVKFDPDNLKGDINPANNNSLTSNSFTLQQSDINCNAGGDVDSDGFTDQQEIFVGTDPKKTDSTAAYVSAPVATSKFTSVNDYKADNFGADPVNLRTGAFQFEQHDIKPIPGRGYPIEIKRSFNSKVPDRLGRIGYGWNISGASYAIADPATKNVLMYHPDGYTEHFSTSDGGASYIPPQGVEGKLYPENGYLVYENLPKLRYIFSKKLGTNLYILEKITDRFGNITNFKYIERKSTPLLSEISDASGRNITFTYGDANDAEFWQRITEIKDNSDPANPHIIQYTYTAGNLTQINDLRTYNGNTETITRKMTYDSNHRVITYEDPRGTILTNEYDSQGRVLKQYEYNPLVDAAGNKHLIYEISYPDGAYAPAPGSVRCTILKTYRTGSNTFTTRMCFNAQELKIYEESGPGITQKWEYTADGMPKMHQDPNGNVTNYEYDSLRRKIKEILPSSNGWATTLSWAYENTFNQVISHIAQTTNSSTGETIKKNWNWTIDAKGQPTAMTDPKGGKENYTYDNFGNLLSVQDAIGHTTGLAYDAGGNNLVQQSKNYLQPDNSTKTSTQKYAYDNRGNLTQYTDANNNITKFYYDNHGLLRQEMNAQGKSKYYTYDSEGHLITAIDEISRVTSYVYDKDINGQLTKINRQGAGGPLTWQYQYDYAQNLTSSTDPQGRVTQYSYDGSNRLIQTKSPGITSNQIYDKNGNVIEATTSAGQKTTFQYDANNQLVSSNIYLGESQKITRNISYDGFGRPTSATDFNGNKSQYIYDLHDNLVEAKDPLGNSSKFGYDAANNRTSVTSPKGSITGFAYDSFGRVIKTTNASDKSSLNFYDPAGNLTKFIDRQNSDGTNSQHVTQFYYDPLNRLVKTVNAEGKSAHLTFDAASRVTLQSDEAGRVTTYQYDDFDRVTKQTDPGSTITQFTYDKAGNIISVKTPDNQNYTYTYNEQDFLVSTQGPLGMNKKFTYDALGNTLTETDSLGGATTYKYDLANRLIEETSATGITTGYSYDPNGNLAQYQTNGQTNSYLYDKNNRLIQTTGQSAKSRSYTYDENGNLATEVNENLGKISYTYDVLDRVKSKKLEPENEISQYTYDNWDNLLSSTSPDLSTQNSFDVMSRLTLEKHTFSDLPGQTKNIARTYAADGQMAQLTDSLGRNFDYQYDGRGLLNSIKYNGASLVDYNYDTLGGLSTANYQNGIKMGFDYDSLHRPTNLKYTAAGGTVLFGEQASYDTESRIKSLTLNSGKKWTLDYDPLGQVTKLQEETANGKNNLYEWKYDTFGNRSQYSSPSGVETYNYSTTAPGQLDNVSKSNGDQLKYTYDNSGNLVKKTLNDLDDTSFNYDWDAEGRLRGISGYRDLMTQGSPLLTADYAYDDSGNRIKKVLEFKSFYTINQGLNPLETFDESGKSLNTQIYGHGLVAEITAEGEIIFAHQNMLGSTVFQSDTGGTVVANYDYDLFGNVSILDNYKTNMLYTGQEYDWENLLHYYNARYYDSETGRFISKDPVAGYSGDLLSRNPYIYVSNNPLMYTDPSGREEDVTNDFIGKLKYNASYIEGFSDWRDSLATSWTVKNKGLLDKLKEKFPHLDDSDINKLKEDDIVWDDLQSTPIKFLEFYNKVKPGGHWDLKNNYPKWNSGWLSFKEMSKIVIKKIKKSNKTITSENFNAIFVGFFMKDPYGYAGLGKVQIGNYDYNNDVAGNLMFGYTGAAAGFEDNTLLKMAGLAQKELDLRENRPITEPWEINYYDQPRDQSAIKAGIKLWKEYGSNIASESFDKVLSDFRNIFNQ